MKEVSLFEAKTHFSGLVNEIMSKQTEIAVTKHGHPVIIMKSFLEAKRPDVAGAIAAIKQLRRGLSALSVDEILEMRDEGRHVRS